MPRAKSLSHYPARYGEIVQACAVRNERIEVELGSVEQCRSLRGHYYAYKGALMREAEAVAAHKRAAPLSPLTPGEEDVLEKAKQSEVVMVTILTTEGRFRVVFENRENSWQALALARAKSSEGESKPTSTELEDIAARLARIKPEAQNGN